MAIEKEMKDILTKLHDVCVHKFADDLDELYGMLDLTSEQEDAIDEFMAEHMPILAEGLLNLAEEHNIDEGSLLVLAQKELDFEMLKADSVERLSKKMEEEEAEEEDEDEDDEDEDEDDGFSIELKPLSKKEAEDIIAKVLKDLRSR